MLIFQQPMITNRSGSRCFRLHFLFQHICLLSLTIRAAISTEKLLTYPLLCFFVIHNYALITERKTLVFGSLLWLSDNENYFNDCSCEFVNNESATSGFIQDDSSRLIYIHIYIHIKSIFLFLFLYIFYISSGPFDIGRSYASNILATQKKQIWLWKFVKQHIMIITSARSHLAYLCFLMFRMYIHAYTPPQCCIFLLFCCHVSDYVLQLSDCLALILSSGFIVWIRAIGQGCDELFVAYKEKAKWILLFGCRAIINGRKNSHLGETYIQVPSNLFKYFLISTICDER